MHPLSPQSLPLLPAAVERPTYDRSRVRPGIVHLGVGGFHRSHQALYIDRLLEEGEAHDWGICGVGVLPSDRGMAEVMAAQDGLYTLVVKHPDGSLDARVDPSRPPAKGETVHLRIQPGREHLFSPSTGRRLPA